jgi:hypothetical protein
MSNESWGIIRYTPRTGNRPEGRPRSLRWLAGAVSFREVGPIDSQLEPGGTQREPPGASAAANDTGRMNAEVPAPQQFLRIASLIEPRLIGAGLAHRNLPSVLRRPVLRAILRPGGRMRGRGRGRRIDLLTRGAQSLQNASPIFIPSTEPFLGPSATASDSS